MLLQTFSANMSVKGRPVLNAAKKKDTFTCVTFKPDLAKFGMLILEEHTVSLMRKRVYDLAGVLGKTVKVAATLQAVSARCLASAIRPAHAVRSSGGAADDRGCSRQHECSPMSESSYTIRCLLCTVS